nr:MAG TPA: hypothetical protein [Caudoviricetes sp.]
MFYANVFCNMLFLPILQAYQRMKFAVTALINLQE